MLARKNYRLWVSQRFPPLITSQLGLTPATIKSRLNED